MYDFYYENKNKRDVFNSGIFEDFKFLAKKKADTYLYQLFVFYTFLTFFKASI
jgi:hypothetical protein